MSKKLFGDTGDVIYRDSNVFQRYDDTCAIQSQRLILERFGINLTQEELIDEATVNGWYTPGTGGGTLIKDVGKLLENHGVEVDVSHDNNIFSLANELAQNHQVIVAVDSSELWERGSWSNSLEDFFMGDVPDHALIVSGLDTTDPNNVQVILTDPGTGDIRIRYSEADFLDAWKDSNFWMMSTEEAPPSECDFFNSDYSFAGIPSDTLQQLADIDMDVTTDQYGDFVTNLCESPDMPWEDIVVTISVFLVKEIVRGAFDSDDDDLSSQFDTSGIDIENELTFDPCVSSDVDDEGLE